MCDAGEYFFWVFAAINGAFIVPSLLLRKRLFKIGASLQEEYEQSRQIWLRRLDDAERIRTEARAYRDQWKVALIMSDAVNSQEGK